MRRREWAVVLGVGVATVYALYRVAVRYWDFGTAAGELPAAIRDYRAVGLPWTAADIATNVPERKNAASLLRHAIEAWPEKDAYGKIDKAFSEGRAAPLLPSLAPSLTLAHEAAKRPQLDYGRDLDLGLFLDFPEGAYVKRIARALALRAELAAARGDDAAALADLEDARRIAVLTGQEPHLIASLVSVSTGMIALGAVEGCLARAAKSPERLKRYAAWVAEPTPLPDVPRAIKGEVYRSIANLRMFPHLGVGRSPVPMADLNAFAADIGPAPVPPSKIPRDGIPQGVRNQAYMARHCQMWTELWRATDGLRGDPDAVGRKWSEIENRHYENDKGLSHGLDAILFPTYGQALKSPLALLARRAVLRALAEAMIAHAAAGRWPAAVKGIDPYTQKPLKVRSDKDGFRVWSVGKDGKDDGGLLLRDRARSSQGRDEVAIYPPLPTTTIRTPPSSLGRGAD